jgi:UDPglucose--hexose-1-phosphate uridylyltransferase
MPSNTSKSLTRPHRRFNPLNGSWVLVAPQRLQRPWQGQIEAQPSFIPPSYDPACFLCPGNVRVDGTQNPYYTQTYIFSNDFAALLPNPNDTEESLDPLYRYQTEQGTCRVLCFAPRHDLTLPELEIETIRNLVDILAEQVNDLGRTYQWVQIFENKGEMMGCSNPHPHGQIWGQNSLPSEAMQEDMHQRLYFEAHGAPLLRDYVDRETISQERVVVENQHWVVVVPYWALWPFETLLLPRRHVRHLPELSGDERDALASILKQLLTRYDNLFEISFPYSMGWHGAPFGHRNDSHWQLHAHFYPPLLRSATVRKFMVGYEMFGEGLRDLTAEQAAQRLRAVPERHYKERSVTG